MAFWSEGNHLHLSGKVNGEIRLISAALHNVVHKQGYSDIILDFSGATYLAPFTMIGIATMCRAYRLERVDFDLVFPRDQKTARLLSNANWSHLILPERFEDRTELNVHNLSATIFTTAEQHHKAVDRSIDLFLSSAEGIDRGKLKALEWSLNEISDNVLNHASSPMGGIMQVVNYRSKGMVEFIVGDAGQTIPRTLREGRADIRDDPSALRAAILEGVTKNTETNRGNGLFGTFKCCEVSGGSFEIVSGNVNLNFSPGQLTVTSDRIPFQGTLVRACINYNFDRLLERALVFGGKPHEPGFDYIDRTYQSDTEHIYFRMTDEVDSFGSREAGRLARTKVSNLMDRATLPIEFDFEEVPLISSSFADEVFGKLFLELGALRFTALCKFKNVDRTVQLLIDRAIAQRLQF